MSTVDPPTPELPVLDTEEVRRADAVRNRAKILVAARELVSENGADCVSMDAIARSAGVGKGTLFRRFGDRGSLLRALLDENEREFQDAILRGAAPLGPGAPPGERLVAFGEALLERLEHDGELVREAEAHAPGARMNHAVYAVYHRHIELLVEAADPALNAHYVADVLLAGLAADLVLHQRRVRETPLPTLKTAWRDLAERLLA